MTSHQRGYALFLAALGALAGLLAPEVSSLSSWSAALSPAFVGKVLLHFSVVVVAFGGGRIIPTSKERQS